MPENKEGKPFYITTTLPYVNADPHVGFALEILQADVLARFWRERLGRDRVFFNTGTDEHGQKLFEAAEKAGKEVKDYVDHYASVFEELKNALNLSYNAFIRTTDPKHQVAAEEMWKRCKESGDIYEKEFEGLYCVGCERYLTQKDMAEGLCVIHGTAPQTLKEKNWFFRLSNYKEKLLEYLSEPAVIVPEWRRQEALAFVNDGLEDFSISRDKSRLSWGLPVPEDETQVMYVWFDALTNYISTLGWPNEGGDFETFWNQGYTLQMAGKDQVRFQSLMWQAMLMSAGIKNTNQVFYHGFITSGGQKMSKSLGNVISPNDLVARYGTDATRYLLLRHVHSTEDTDVTWEKLDEWYSAGLVKGLGNLVSRIMKMAEGYLDYPVSVEGGKAHIISEKLQSFNFQEALDRVFEAMGALDLEIQNTEPFKLIKTDSERAKQITKRLVTELSKIATELAPFMPEISEKIVEAIRLNKKPENLFPPLHA